MSDNDTARRLALLEAAHSKIADLAVTNVELSTRVLQAEHRIVKLCLATSEIIDLYDRDTVTEKDKEQFADLIKECLGSYPEQQ